MSNLNIKVLLFVICALVLFCHLCFGICHLTFAQQSDSLEFNLDVNSNVANLPNIFKANIDLSGRGFATSSSWPQGLASPEALEAWQKDIGFSGIYRIQYNLWEIYELAKYKDAQDKLLANYEGIIKKISDAGGTVILNIFGTPAGLGRILDKKSPVVDFRAFKELIKNHMRNLSCEKRYNIWYEVWSAPDIDDFFLGRRQDYFNLYRAVSESAKELEAETKIHIPVGGPSLSWWFQDLDGNTIITPEKSLVYELIKFCYHYRYPLDFISWHAYSLDNKPEKEVTRYNKTPVALIRDWLSYFHFDRNTPLIIDEWNYDSGANMLPERGEKANICSSYILSRLKNMYEAGINYQLYFSLEDFQNYKENVIRNVGIFWFDHESSKYKGGPKSIYNVFRMLANLGNKMYFSPKFEDEFVGVIATKGRDESIQLIIYNYADANTATNYLSRNVARLNEKQRRILIKLIKKGAIEKVTRHQLTLESLHCPKKLTSLIKKALELNAQAEKMKGSTRNLKINLKNLKGVYLYQRYLLDDTCNIDCEFKPIEEKVVSPVNNLLQEGVSLKPYSVNMIILKKKPNEPKIISAAPVEQAAVGVSVANVTANVTDTQK